MVQHFFWREEDLLLHAFRATVPSASSAVDSYYNSKRHSPGHQTARHRRMPSDVPGRVVDRRPCRRADHPRRRPILSGVTASSEPVSDDELTPQGLALTLLGDYVLPDARTVWSGGLVQLLEEFGITTASARLALSRLTKKGLIERSRDGRLTYYSLSASGARLLEEGRRRIFSFGREAPWDGTWTVVSYSIPEGRRAVRERLRKRLEFLGFASVHDGTWFSPRDREAAVGDLLQELELGAHAEVFLGRPSSRTDVEALVSRAWALGDLRRRYREFVTRFGPYVDPAVQRGLSDRDALLVRTRLMHVFRRFPMLDPELPDELVGDHWQRAEAVDIRHAVWTALEGPGARHFARVTDPR